MIEPLRLPARGLTFDALAAGPTTGELVMLLHGFPQTSACWTLLLETLAAAGYRAVAPDQRGYSPTARPTTVSAYRLRELVADVVAIAYRLDAETFHLVGHDWGGVVAWRLGRYLHSCPGPAGCAVGGAGLVPGGHAVQPAGPSGERADAVCLGLG
jgi:pimeloyl-ACP methyl ester carboxylesterase